MALVDITETGKLRYDDLQRQNAEDFNFNDEPEISSRSSSSQSTPVDFSKINPASAKESAFNPSYAAEESVHSSLQNQNDYFGRSKYDRNDVNAEEFNNRLGDIRASGQSTLSKYGAGITKGVVLSGTTFLDGTIGLLYGIGDSIANIGNKDETGFQTFSRIWDNELSNGLQEINKQLEDILPNYRSTLEQNNKWYQNLGTANFWADSFLKNMGFTIGAFYSGGAWNKALKGIGLLKSSTGASVIGSFLSAVNEARIEANNNSNDWYDLEKAKIDDNYRMIMNDSSKSDSEKEMSSFLYKQQLRNLDENKAKMGLTDFIGNTILLSLDNISQFGKLYARGFENASRIAGRDLERNVKSKLIDGVRQYEFDKIGTGKAMLKGLQHGLEEGNEELAQAFLSEFSGNWFSPDSPDAYYDALLNHNSAIKTKDFLTSAAQGFVNTYGNGDRYEEFAVGFLTGLLGMPTFGRVNNSDGNTWLGKGKIIGLSGGIGGEIANARNFNAEGQEVIDYANEYMRKQSDLVGHFTRSQSFTDAMDAYARDNDAFEFKNAEDNNDFLAIARFARMGRLADIKEMIDRDYANISDSDLEAIASSTTQADGFSGWRNEDGSFMHETPEGKAKMKELLKEKAEKIKSEIDNYEDALASIRGIGNGTLDADKESEMAWLKWKINRFESRFKELQKDPATEFDSLIADLDEFDKALSESREGFDEDSQYYGDEHISIYDEDLDENQKLTNNVRMLKLIFNNIKNGRDLTNVFSHLDSKYLDLLDDKDFLSNFLDISTLDSVDFNKAMSNIRDMRKLYAAKKSFSERLQEYTENPLAQDKRRAKKDAEANVRNEVLDSNKKTVEAAGLTAEEARTVSRDDLDDYLNAAEGMAESSGAQVIRNEIDRRDMAEAIDSAIDSSNFSNEEISAAHSLFDKVKGIAVTSDELTDMNTEAYQDFDPEVMTQEEYDMAIEVLKAVNKSVAENRAGVEDVSIEGFEAFMEAREGEEGKEMQSGKDGPTSISPVEAVSPNKRNSDERTIRTYALQLFSKFSNGLSDTQKIEALNDICIPIIKLSLNAYNSGIQDWRKVAYESIYTIPKFNDYVSNYPIILDALDAFMNNLENPAIGDSRAMVPEKLNLGVAATEAPTITSSVEDVQDSTELYSDKGLIYINTDDREGEYKYWKPQTTLYPIHGKPEELDKKFIESVNESHPMYRRLEAVTDFLVKEGAFDRRDFGNNIHSKDKIFFKTFKEVNNKAGETVIFMVDEDGHVLGDIASLQEKQSMHDSTKPGVLNNQEGLEEFIKIFYDEYKGHEDEDAFQSSVSTVVGSCLTGRIPYDYANGVKKMHTLNELYEGGAFTLGVAVSDTNINIDPANKKKLGPSDAELNIKTPKKMIPGQVFLIFNSGIGDRTVALPFHVPVFNSDAMDGTAFKNELVNVLGEMYDSKSKKDLMNSVDNLNYLIGFNRDNSSGESASSLRVYNSKFNSSRTIILGDAKHTLTVRFNGHQVISQDIDTLTKEEFVNKMLDALNGTKINISRSHINFKFRERIDYNKMIGEIAQINLVPGMTHCIGNWFRVIPPKAAMKKVSEKLKASESKNASIVSDDLEILRKDGIFDEPGYGELNKDMWDHLPESVKKHIIGKSSRAKANIFVKLRHEYDENTHKFYDKDGLLSRLSAPKNREVDESSPVRTFDEKKELEWLSKVLPALSSDEHLRVVKGVIHTGDYRNPISVWGHYSNGMITISNTAAKGTVYHEAFHAVTDMLLSSDELREMYDAAREEYGNIGTMQLEEKLAEAFREYVEFEEKPISGVLVKIFRTLRELVRKISGKKFQLDSLFYRINNGYYSERSFDKVSYNDKVADIQYYHSLEYEYDKLSPDKRAYLDDNGISDIEYNKLSTVEREIMFKCR